MDQVSPQEVTFPLYLHIGVKIIFPLLESWQTANVFSSNYIYKCQKEKRKSKFIRLNIDLQCQAQSFQNTDVLPQTLDYKIEDENIQV